ncbi:MAG: hypothetical protein OSJ60_19815 [Lachnospiraceae bacterium]|nr:hypothetical protein [Lachnospiraceae bacterium]
MNEEFARKIYETIVEEGRDMYKNLYDNTKIKKNTVPYWKSALSLYQDFDDEQKKVFLDVIKHIIIDTISSVFGVLDGSSTLSGGNLEFEVIINGISTSNELQDTFLEIVEEKNS